MAVIAASSSLCVAAADDHRYERHGRSGDWQMIAEIDPSTEHGVMWTAMPNDRSLPVATFSCHASAGCVLHVFAEDPLPDGWQNRETKVLINVDDEPVFEVGGDVFRPPLEDLNLVKEMGEVIAILAGGNMLRMRIYPNRDDRDPNGSDLTLNQSLVGFGDAAAWVIEQMYQGSLLVESAGPAQTESSTESEVGRPKEADERGSGSPTPGDRPIDSRWPRLIQTTRSTTFDYSFASVCGRNARCLQRLEE